jgi:hypothetical protein
MADMLRWPTWGGLLAISCTLTLSASAAAAGPPVKDLFEWLPNGERNGPELVIEAKGTGAVVSGKFGVQCGKNWLFAIYGGGFTLDQATGMLTGTANYPAGSIGMGSTYRNAEINFFDFKTAGPVSMTLDAQTSTAAAVGTISFKRYTVIPAHGRPPHRTKAKKLLSASCSLQFDAPNFYYQPPAPPETPPGE